MPEPQRNVQYPVPWSARRRALKADLLAALAGHFDAAGWDFVADDHGLSEDAVESVVHEISDEMFRRAGRLLR